MVANRRQNKAFRDELRALRKRIKVSQNKFSRFLHVYTGHRISRKQYGLVETGNASYDEAFVAAVILLDKLSPSGCLLADDWWRLSGFVPPDIEAAILNEPTACETVRFFLGITKE